MRPTPMLTHTFASPLGPITVAATHEGLAGLWFDGHRHMPDPTGWTPAPDHFGAVEAQVLELLAGRRRTFDGPLAPARGTPWQLRVWAALADIPYGETVTYAELAERVCTRRASRAVGAANGRNPLSLVVPCHRVVGTGGALTGYGGGLERKRALLALEAAACAAVA